MRKSNILRKLRNGDWVLVTNISFNASPKTAELVGTIGFDGIFIDMEHMTYEYDKVFQMIQGTRITGTDSLVRIRKDSYADYFRPLEDGATGIVVPHCKSREEAEFAVYNTKYHPIGKRGIDGTGVDADFGMSDPLKYMDHANSETFLVVMAEDSQAVDNIEKIVSVKGVDIIYIGLADLSQSYGITFEMKNTIITGAVKKIAEACGRCGKWWGASVGTVEQAQGYLDMGARFILAGDDWTPVVEGFNRVKSDYSQLKPRNK